MKKLLPIWLLAVLLTVTTFTTSGCSNKENNIVIYSSSDQVRNAMYMEMLTEKFPDYEIDIMYMTNGVQASRLLAEGNNTTADISISLEISYLLQLGDLLKDLSELDFDISNILPELLDSNNKYLPWEIFNGVIAINEDLLNELGIPVPTTYDELLHPRYQGLISMANPQSSSAGHIFVIYFVERMGEDQAFAFFNELALNINQFHSSGSGVTTSLLNEDIAIGFTWLHNAINEIERGANISLSFLDEYSPSSMGGIALTANGSQKSAAVEVFEYLINEVSLVDKQLYSPGKVFINQISKNTHYPSDIQHKFCIIDPERREQLLDRWSH